MSQFRKGIARARTIVNAARQAIARPGAQGAVLTGAPEAAAPQDAEAEPPAEPPPAPRPEQS